MAQILHDSFEGGWTHLAHVFPDGGQPYLTEIGNIFTPEGWVTWFVHGGENGYVQPEVRDARDHDPDRMYSGEKGIVVFTFGKLHHAGLYRQVLVAPGQRLQLSAWAHAWSNHKDKNRPEAFPHPDDPRWSEGPGYDPGYILEGEAPPPNGDPQNDALPNFTFSLGIDPTGGTNPLADTVIWGRGAHIYNVFAQPPTVETVAQSNQITIFLRAKTVWPFKHNDGYWDDVLLTGEGGRGQPRVQYERTYVLLPPTANHDWWGAINEAVTDKFRVTIGCSADDGGIGDLDYRRVIAVNPDDWGDSLENFFGQYYPGVIYIPVTATLADIGQKVLDILDDTTPPPPPELLLCQCDEPWGDDPLGGGDCSSTICQNGCYVTNLAMAQKYYDIKPDATPLTVNQALGPTGFAGCDVKWSALPDALGLEIIGTTGADEHLAGGNICMAEILPTSLQHFVLVTEKRGDRYRMYDPWKCREAWLDEYYAGVESWRLLRPVAPPPPPDRMTRGHIGLHLQSLWDGVDEFSQIPPPLVKVFSFEDVIYGLQQNPYITPVYRFHTDGYDEYWHNPDVVDAGRDWINNFRDALIRTSQIMATNWPNAILIVEAYNELYPSANPEVVAHVADMDRGVILALAEMGLPNVRAGVFCAAVGNPREDEVRLLVETGLAQCAVAHDARFGYHGYWTGDPTAGGPDLHWPYLAGRWQEIDKVLVAYGHKVKWYGGESGLCAGDWGEDEVPLLMRDAHFVNEAKRKLGDYKTHKRLIRFGQPGVALENVGPMGWVWLDPTSGWLHPTGYDGDWDRYLADIMAYDYNCRRWNPAHEDRYLGTVLFTTCPHYMGWESFQIRRNEMMGIRAAILARYMQAMMEGVG